MTTRLLTTSLCAATFATSTVADIVNNDTTIVQGSLCVGSSCIDGESGLGLAGDGVTKLKGNNPQLYFEDTSNNGVSAESDWRLRAGNSNSEGFFLEDVTNGSMPVSVAIGAPSNSLFVSTLGQIGMGTKFPFRDLHIRRLDTPSLRLDQVGLSGTPTQIWDIFANDVLFALKDHTADTTPLGVATGAPNDALYVDGAGNIGLGTDTPTAQFEMSSDNAFNFFRITATGAAVNDSVDITFTGGPLGTGQLRYNIVDGDNQEMSLDADGNMVLDGTLTTAGPTCAGGCDQVFEAGYALPSIEDHAAAMYAAQHLPSIGATLPHAPVNLSERQGNIINALEHAHIYIDQLHRDAAADRAEIADLRASHTALLARFEALEAQ